MGSSSFRDKLGRTFVITVEVVPPAVGVCADLIQKIIHSLGTLSVDALNLADSPMACPRMSPLLFAQAIRSEIPEAVEIIPHITVRDRNRVALRGMILGSIATGTRSVLIVSGDPVHFSNDPATRHVGDLTVAELVRTACDAGLLAGVVMDPSRERRRQELSKLESKLEAGAGFVITQPVYDPRELEALLRDLRPFKSAFLLGLLPLISSRHAHFLHDRVPGISVPDQVMAAIDSAGEKAIQVGIELSRRMLQEARREMAGACIMPPFARFDLVPDILG